MIPLFSTDSSKGSIPVYSMKRYVPHPGHERQIRASGLLNAIGPRSVCHREDPLPE
ncbi:hypothetical protein D3OALGB2SA_3627 [Olavius algarvensis associated proteobacterium Delta 3]|nr:hypothetical protein D3OALGB2SA_3627 [Olavius algarvensis associated proteobacterium Delta 3]